MQGYHEVKAFGFNPGEDSYSDVVLSLPIGWKPFASFNEFGFVYVLARKWYKEDEFPKHTQVEQTNQKSDSPKA